MSTPRQARFRRAFAFPIVRNLRSVHLRLAAIVTLGLALRLWRVDQPPVDFPADRQITTAILIEAKAGGRPLEAFTFRHVTGDTDPLILMPEAPVVPLLAAMTKRAPLAGRLDAFTLARLWTIAFSLVTALLAFDLGRRWFSRRVGELAALALAVAPASVYCGRTVIPDVPMAAFMLAALCAADRLAGEARRIFTRRPGAGRDVTRAPYLMRQSDWMVLAPRTLQWLSLLLIAIAFATLAKLYGALVVLPVATLFAVSLWGRPRLLAALTAVVLLVALAAAVAWYPISPAAPGRDLARMSQGTNSLFQTLWTYFGTRPMLTVFLNRLELTLTFTGLLLAGCGLAAAVCRPGGWPLAVWTGATLTFGLLTVGANTYWFYLALPPAALCAAVALDGLAGFVERHAGPGRLAVLAGHVLLAGVVLAGVALSPAVEKIRRSYYPPDYRPIAAGAFAAEHAPAGAKLLTCGAVPFDILWASGRSGWSVRRDETFFLSPPHRDDWRLAVVGDPGPFAAFNALFGAVPLTAARPGVALFQNAASEDRSAPADAPARQALTPLRRPLRFSNGARLVASALTPLDAATTGTAVRGDLESLTVWDLSDAPHGLEGTFLAVQWARDGGDGTGDEGMGPFRLAPGDGGVHLPGEAFSRLQTAPRVEPAPAGLRGYGDGETLVALRHRFHVPPHLPAGRWRMRLALGNLEDSRLFVIEPPDGRWAAMQAFARPSVAAPQGPDGAIDLAALFVPAADYGHSPAPAGGALTLTAEMGDVWMDLGPSRAERELVIEGYARPAPGETVTLVVETAPGAPGGGAEATGGAAMTFDRKGAIRVVAPLPAGMAAPWARLALADSLDDGAQRGADRWPLYLDEVPLWRGEVEIGAIKIMERKAMVNEQ